MTISTSDYFKRLASYTEASIQWCSLELDAMAGKMQDSMQDILKELTGRIAPVDARNTALSALDQLLINSKTGQEQFDYDEILRHLTSLGHDQNELDGLLSPFFTVLNRRNELKQNLNHIDTIVKLWTTYRDCYDDAKAMQEFSDQIKALTLWTQKDMTKRLNNGRPTSKSAS